MTYVFLLYNPIDGATWQWQDVPEDAVWIGRGGWGDPDMPREEQWKVQDVERFEQCLSRQLSKLQEQGIIGPKWKIRVGLL